MIALIDITWCGPHTYSSYILSQPITEESEAATNADKLEPIEMHITALLLPKISKGLEHTPYC
jgi:hypothetical protein